MRKYLLASLLSPTLAFAQTHTITAAQLTFTGQTEIVDVAGQYGVAGRHLILGDLVAELEGAGIADNTGGSWGLSTPYRLQYALHDAETGLHVADGGLSVTFYQVGHPVGGDIFLTGWTDVHAAPDAGSVFYQEEIDGYTDPLWNNGFYRYDYTSRYTLQGNRLTTNSSGYNADKWHVFTIAPEFGGGYLYALADGYIDIASPVPEPGPMTLIMAGLASIGLARRRSS